MPSHETTPSIATPEQQAEHSLTLREIGLRTCLAAIAITPAVVPAVAHASNTSKLPEAPADYLSANEVFGIPNSSSEFGPHQNKIVGTGKIALRETKSLNGSYAEFANTPASSGKIKKRGRTYIHCNYYLYYPRNIELEPIPAVVEGKLEIRSCHNVRGRAVRMTAYTGLNRIPLDDLGNFDMKNQQLESLGEVHVPRLFRSGEGDTATWFCMKYGADDALFPEYWATSVQFSALSVVPKNGDDVIVQSSSNPFMTRPKKVLCN